MLNYDWIIKNEIFSRHNPNPSMAKLKIISFSSSWTGDIPQLKYSYSKICSQGLKISFSLYHHLWPRRVKKLNPLLICINIDCTRSNCNLLVWHCCFTVTGFYMLSSLTSLIDQIFLSIKTALNKDPSWILRMNLFAKHCKVIWSHAEFKFSSQTAPKLSFAISEQIIIKTVFIFEFFFSVFLILRNPSNRKNWLNSNTWSGEPSGDYRDDLRLFFAEFAASC